ncbi:MAG: GspH/FimT family protein [Hydrogenophilus sp.]|nr:GspH/FimT family protein [Hydrogenophilus sp.]
MMNAPRGLTLPETLLVLLLAAILTAIAVPPLQRFLVRESLTAYANEFLAAFNLARLEAIRRRTSTTLCRSADYHSCDTENRGWEIGWILYEDRNADGTRQTATEPLIRAWGPLAARYTLRSNISNFTHRIRFNPLGVVANNGVGGLLILCYDNERVGARAIVIRPLRPRLALDTNGNGIPESESGDIERCS